MFPKTATARKGLSLVPRIETRRLILDTHRVSDFDDLHLMWSDPAIVQHIGGEPSTRKDSWARLLRYSGLWPILGYGYWAVRDKSSGQYIGDVGFGDFYRDAEPSIIGIPEAGWVLKGSFHGRGLASEALAAAVGWLDGTERFQETCCLVSRNNPASLRVAEKAQYRPSGTVLLSGQEVPFFLRRTPNSVSCRTAHG